MFSGVQSATNNMIKAAQKMMPSEAVYINAKRVVVLGLTTAAIVAISKFDSNPEINLMYPSNETNAAEFYNDEANLTRFNPMVNLEVLVSGLPENTTLNVSSLADSETCFGEKSNNTNVSDNSFESFPLSKELNSKRGFKPIAALLSSWSLVFMQLLRIAFPKG